MIFRTRRGFGEREPSPPSAETVASSLRDALVAAEETGLLDSETSDEAKQLLSDIPSIVAKKVATKPLNEAIQNVREGSRHRGRVTLCLEGLIQEVSSAEGVAESAVLEEAKQLAKEVASNRLSKGIQDCKNENMRSMNGNCQPGAFPVLPPLR